MECTRDQTWSAPSIHSTLRNKLVLTELNIHLINCTPLVQIRRAIVILAFLCNKPCESSSKGMTDEVSVKKETEEAQRREEVAMVWTVYG